ncbi:unnamed protein product [Parascedosporium putredinis]|uniref:Uncharacterized protein n=1 Tax=Parascedosporium putredinis TaxID=1442378 RepID=A0A9P1H877_9PEZI|nr:unnamed protein product [Parascedosporium putredinis]CAI8000366.1 unnamed protein product [Parascedosporium putredinis]
MPEDNESASRSEEYSDENKCSVPSQEKRPERSRVVTIPDSDDEAEDLDDGDNLDNPAREQTPTRHSLKAAKSGKRIEPGGEKQNEEDAYAVGEETQFALDLLASGTEGTLSTIQSGYQETSQNSSRKRPDPVKQTPRQTRKKATVTFSSPQFCPDEEDDHAAQHKTQVYTQMNSQRVDLAIIRAMPPPTDRSDIFISIHPQHVQKIVNGTKDHEFRTWKIPSTVSRIWIYVTKPESMLRYMACIGPAKVPGEIVNERGIGNAEFNKKAGKPGFAYEIEELYELNNPVPLKRMKDNGWVDAAPQKYAFVPPVVVSQLQANLRCQLLLDDDGEGPIFEDEINASQPKQSATLSQETGEVEAQLLSDIAYSTQHPHRTTGPTQPIFHDSGSPVRIPEGDFDLRTSQLVTASQLLPETLMRDDESGPPMG